MTQLVQGKRLRRTFGNGAGERVAIDGVDLHICTGEFLAVFGPSGSGKSTLLAIVGGLDRGFAGELRLGGQDVRAMSDRALSHYRGEKLGFVFQGFYLLDHLSVLDNVLVPSMFTPRAGAEAAARAALDRVGLADREKDTTAGLSGGQRQRVAIARAIAHKPALLLCDEPTGNLDESTAVQVIDIFSTLNRDDGVTVFCATHDERIAKVASRTIQLIDGQIQGEAGGERAGA